MSSLSNIDPSLLVTADSMEQPVNLEILGNVDGNLTATSVPADRIEEVGGGGEGTQIQPKYHSHTVAQLKALCKARNLKIGGSKSALQQRLKEFDDREDDAEREHVNLPSNDSGTAVIDISKVVEDAVAMEDYFQTGLTGHFDDEKSGGESSDSELEDADNTPALDNEKTHDALVWVDKFILDTRRKGGRQTENSVLKLWRTWTASAIDTGTIPDTVVDAAHVIEYLKYASTRQLFRRNGTHKSSGGSLSLSSLKKIMTMLGRVRQRQEDEDPSLSNKRPYSSSRTKDYYKAVMVQAQRLRLSSENFDITKGTILDSELRPDQFNEVTVAVFDKLTHLLSGGKLPPSHRLQFGVLAMYHETKTAKPGNTEPKYSYVLPHRDPLRCPVGALAIHLHYMFDQGKLISQVPSWDWSDSSIWRSIHVLFGKKVEDSMMGDGLGWMYSSFLEHTSITSKEKTHLVRRAVPTLLEEMGVPPEQVDVTGHWQGNTRQEVYGSKIPKLATVALAGFPVGEIYNAPWTQVDVPHLLEQQIFPFCESAIAHLRASECDNQGTLNFLELLQALRPYFWRAISAINYRFPGSALIKRLAVLSHNNAGREFMQQWDILRQKEESTHDRMTDIGQAFHEVPTQNAFATISAQIQGIQSALSVIKQHTEQLSPSKPSKPREIIVASTAPHVAELNMPLAHSRGNQRNTVEHPTPPHLLRESEDREILGPSSSNHNISDRQDVTAPLCAGPTRPDVQLVPTNILTPEKIVGPHGTIFHILRLAGSAPTASSSAGNSDPSHTPYDLILPPPAAFPHTTYPRFTTCECTWTYTLRAVSDSSHLWECYAPKNLGDYPSIAALWEAWDEGTYIPDIGRSAPLRLIEERYGNLKNEVTNKGKLSSWRPRNDVKARKTWSNFCFFIHRIEDMIKTGKSSDESVQYLDDLRKDGNKSLSQLMKSLQPKRGEKRKTPCT